MALTPVKTTLVIKNDAASFTTNNIIPNATDANLIKFADAYNSLQKDPAEKYLKRVEHLITE